MTPNGPAPSEKHDQPIEELERTEVVHHSEKSQFIVPDAAEEARVIRKLDWNVLPLVFVLYSLSVLDRSNLGNAKLAGLQTDIKLTSYKYNWLGTIFYISYILFQWLITGWKQFKPHRWAAAVVFGWGFVATIQATVFTWGGLMACRAFLGIFEAAFGPGVPLYLTFLYPRERVGFRHGIFISGAAIANAYGGALAYGISHIKGSVAPWKILFIIEGVPTCLLAIVAWYFLPDSLDKCRFLNAREQEVAKYMNAQGQKSDSEDHKSGIRFKELLEAFKDPKAYIPGMMYFSCNVSYASLPLFVPTIISEIGIFSTIQSNGLSGPPYLLCFFVIIGLTYFSDRFRVRGPFCATAGLISAIGFIILATTSAPAPRYLGVFFAVNIFASVALLLAWTANMHASESRRAGGYTILATLGQCGPLVGTNIFPDNEKPYYRKGMWISAAFSLLVVALSILLSFWLYHENRKLDQQGRAAPGGNAAVDEDTGEEQTYRYQW